MFQRFTEKARRSIFFARYEASRYPSGWIEAEHLLLALVREDTKLRMRVDNRAEEEIRGAISGIYAEVPSISTSADLPLSQTAKHILQQGEKEADELRHPDIDTYHLVLGLCKIGTAGELLRKYGVDYESYRQALVTPPAIASNVRPASPEPEEPQRPKARAASLESAILRMEQLIEWTSSQCASQADAFGDQRLKRKPWSRKEAVGHLIDYAIAHHGWIARAMTEPRPNLSGRPEDQWVYELSYADYAWRDLLDVWESVNLLLVHVLLHLREEKLDAICRVGVEEPLPLRELVMRYVDYCEDIAGQILAHG